MSCEKYKSRIADFTAADVEAAFRPADVPSGPDFAAADVEAAFRPADVPLDPDLAAHLKFCPACRAALDAQRALLASIDRGLASMVAGEPSGDFAAHVRRRIAENASAPRPWFAGWLPVTAAALALIVLVSFWMIRRENAPPESARETLPAPVAPSGKAREAAPLEAVRTEPSSSVARGHRPPREQQSAAIREPEVLVPRGEMAAVMRLYNANWNGKADGATLMSAVVPTAELLKPLTTLELNISPLQIEQLGEEEKSKGSSENR